LRDDDQLLPWHEDTVYRIEPMTAADVPEVGRVERRCFANPWPPSAYRRELQVPEQNYYVVLREADPGTIADARAVATIPSENGAHGERSVPRRTLLPLALGRKLRRGAETPATRSPILGFAGMWLAFDEAHVATIGVDPDFRGRGLGELLLVAMFDEAFRRHTNWLTLEVRVSNTPAQALYQKYGFYEQGRRKRYYSDNNEDALIMWSESLTDPAYQVRIERLRDQLLDRLDAHPADLGLSPSRANGSRP
jgi:ribosomal-protein-alanine N-acetyltransferase